MSVLPGGLAADLSALKARFPDVELDADTFERHVARHLPPAGGLEGLELADLYLAAAAVDGSPAAVARVMEFLRTLLPRLQGMGLSAAEAEESLSVLAERLLTARADGAPRLLEYAGRGPLEGWLRASATREALGRLRQGRREEPLEDFELVDGTRAGRSPELELLRSQYRGELRPAFAAAFTRLSVRDRNLLRQHHLDGVTTDALAKLHQVHRATAVRWLAGARAALLEALRDELATRLRIQRLEVDSFIRALESQLDLSLSGLLGSKEREP